MSDYLPPDVLTEILVRLPVKPLLRSRCVCREWCSLISSPNFISKHLSFSSSHSSRTLVRHYSKLYRKEIYSVYDDETFNPQNGTQIRFPFHDKSQFYFRVVGYCNGLLCLSDDLFHYRETIILWNPSIKRAVTLPTPMTVLNSSGPYQFALGFGFASESNDYKVVRVAYLLPDGERLPVLPIPRVEIFSLSTGVWRRLRNDVKSYIPDQFWSQGFNHGSVHWVAFKVTSKKGYGKDCCNLILKFDMSSKEFVEWGLPEELTSVLPTNVCATTVKGFLSVLHNDAFKKSAFTSSLRVDYGSCSIWVMMDYGNVESWTKIYNVSLEPGLWSFLGFRRDGDTLFSGRSGELVSYNFENKAVTGTGICGTKYSFFVDEYVESLVLLGMGTEVRGRDPEPDYEDEDEIVENAEFQNKIHTLKSIALMVML